MDVVTHVQTFVAVVRCGNFSEAARQLGVVPSVVARRIAQFEAALNTRLFERTTRRVVLTEVGERLFGRAGALVGEFGELLRSLERDEGQLVGQLKVMAPTTLTMLQLARPFSDFLAAHPGITLELALEDGSVNPAEGGFDMAISGRTAGYEGVVDMPLAPVGLQLCVAPSHLAAHGALAHPRDLVDRPCLVFKPTGTTWDFHGAQGALSVDVRPRLVAEDNKTLLRAAVAGLGFALLPRYITMQALADGELQVALPAFKVQETWFKAYVPKRRMQVERVRALLRHLQTQWAPGFSALAEVSPPATGPVKPSRAAG